MSTTRTSLVSGGLDLALGKRRWCLAAAAQCGAGCGLHAAAHSLEPRNVPLLLMSDNAKKKERMERPG